MALHIDITALEKFLAGTSVSPDYRAFKGFEDDLRGDLNPTGLLDRLFWHERRWLDFPDFRLLYWREHKERLRQTFAGQMDALGPEFFRHLAARLYRTQFGFLTEYHAVALAEAVFAKHGCTVERSPEMDRIGVDFTVRGLDVPYHVHIFVDSERAWGYRQYKRAQKASDRVYGAHIDFPYRVTGGCLHSLRMLPNGFGVYKRGYVEHLYETLQSGRARGRQQPRVDCRLGLIFDPLIKENT